MNKKVLLMLIMLISASYSSLTIFSYDNRTASNLSSYCNIDFRGLADTQTTKITGATLSIVDLRYASNPLEKFFSIDIDGKTYDIDNIELSAQSPSYAPQDLSTGKFLKFTNTLFVTFPPELLPEITKANTVKVSFKYVGNDKVIELPLSAVDLQYWKNQLPSL